MWATLHPEMLAFAALGAFALWLRLKYGPSFFEGLEELVNEIIDDFRIRVAFQLLLFVGFGAVLSVLMVEPGTYRQALAAGMSWTALLGTIAKSPPKATNRRKSDGTNTSK